LNAEAKNPDDLVDIRGTIMPNIEIIEGVGEAYAKKLSQAAITTTEALLKAGATMRGREEIAAKSGISKDLILRWVNHADLFRVDGIGRQYAELLEAAGVGSVLELTHRNADHLRRQLSEVNESRHLVHQVPSASQVESWIKSAIGLPRVVNH